MTTPKEIPVTTTHPEGTLALITWTWPRGQTVTTNAIRGKGTHEGQGYWRTDRADVVDSLVSKIVPVVPIDLTDAAGLGLIVDDATRHGDLTVHQLLYALREHRHRTTTAPTEGFSPGTFHCPVCAIRAGDTDQRPIQHPASNSEGRKRTHASGITGGL